MVKASLDWQKLLDSNYGIMLMLPFFSVHTQKGGVSSQESAQELINSGVGLAEFNNGICRFVSQSGRNTYLMPCYSYFREVFKLCAGK